MKHVVIRTAVLHEIELLEDLQRAASLANPGDREALLAHPEAIELPPAQVADGDVFVAESAGRIVGFAALLAREDGDAQLDGLFVHPARWRSGFGRALVDHCAGVALARGATLLHVIGNPHAEGFYRACGFVSLGTAQTQFGPGLLMRRALLQSRA